MTSKQKEETSITMTVNNLEYKWFGHASIKLIGEKILYIDPFQIPKTFSDADIILCTHDHYDHCSIDDIKKVMKETTNRISRL